MAKPKIISIPRERPHRCCECPLLGVIPPKRLKKGERFTLRCFLPEHQREISGRGAKVEDKKYLFRCRPDDYNKIVATTNGDIPVSAEDYYDYELDKTAWLWERDKRITQERDNETTKTL